MGYNGSDIYRRMHANPSTTATLNEAKGASEDLKTAHKDLADEIRRIQTKIDEYWVGESADAAKYSLGPIIQASDDAASTLGSSKTVLNNQSESFTRTQGSLKPMEGGEPDVSWYQKGIWWESDAEESARKWNENNQHNINQYRTYDTSTRSNINTMPTAYPTLGDSFNGVPLTREGGGEVGSRGTGTPSVGGSTGGSLGSGSGYGGMTGTSGTPHVNAPAASAGAGSGQYTSSAGGYTSPQGTTPGGTTPAGYGSGPYGGPGAGGLGSTPYGAGGFGGADRARRGSGTDFGAGGGAAAFGPIGGGGAAGGVAGGAGGGAGGAGQGLGAGRATGAGMPSSAGGGGAVGAGGPGGAGAGRGGMGGGMMGAGAGRGGGDDDKEHQRKYGLDSDEWFNPERDEDGGILRDPVTGMPVVPPVIGE